MAARKGSYTKALATTICARIMDGEKLRDICSDDDMPARSSVFKWLAENEDFADQYARAMEVRAEGLFDELFDIADDGQNDWMERRDSDGECIGWRENGESIGRSRLRVDTRKWAISKMLPRKYGDKIEHAGSFTVNLSADVAKL